MLIRRALQLVGVEAACTLALDTTLTVSTITGKVIAQDDAIRGLWTLPLWLRVLIGAPLPALSVLLV